MQSVWLLLFTVVADLYQDPKNYTYVHHDSAAEQYYELRHVAAPEQHYELHRDAAPVRQHVLHHSALTPTRTGFRCEEHVRSSVNKARAGHGRLYNNIYQSRRTNYPRRNPLGNKARADYGRLYNYFKQRAYPMSRSKSTRPRGFSTDADSDRDDNRRSSGKNPPNFDGTNYEEWRKRLTVWEATYPKFATDKTAGPKLLGSLKAEVFNLVTSLLDCTQWSYVRIKKVLEENYGKHQYIRLWEKSQALFNCKRGRRRMEEWLREWQCCASDAQSNGVQLGSEMLGIVAIMGAELTVTQRSGILSGFHNKSAVPGLQEVVLALKAVGDSHNLASEGTQQRNQERRALAAETEEDDEYLRDVLEDQGYDDDDINNILAVAGKGKGKGKGKTNYQNNGKGGATLKFGKCKYCSKGHPSEKCWKQFPELRPEKAAVHSATNALLSFSDISSTAPGEAIIDSGADTDMLAGETWANAFIRLLRQKQRKDASCPKVEVMPTSNIRYKFGAGTRPVIQTWRVPIWTRGGYSMRKLDVVRGLLPCLVGWLFQHACGLVPIAARGKAYWMGGTAGACEFTENEKLKWWEANTRALGGALMLNLCKTYTPKQKRACDQEEYVVSDCDRCCDPTVVQQPPVRNQASLCALPRPLSSARSHAVFGSSPEPNTLKDQLIQAALTRGDRHLNDFAARDFTSVLSEHAGVYSSAEIHQASQCHSVVQNVAGDSTDGRPFPKTSSRGTGETPVVCIFAGQQSGHAGSDRSYISIEEQPSTLDPRAGGDVEPENNADITVHSESEVDQNTGNHGELPNSVLGLTRKDVVKLHSAGHVSQKRLFDLLVSSLRPVDRRGKDAQKSLRDLRKLCKSVAQSCEWCNERKPPRPPKTCLSKSTVFNERVVADVVQLELDVQDQPSDGAPRAAKVLTLVDEATGLKVYTLLREHTAAEVAHAILDRWVRVWGAPKTLLHDMGHEFCGIEMRDALAAMNSVGLTSPAYAPWSHGVVERANRTLLEALAGQWNRSESNRDGRMPSPRMVESKLAGVENVLNNLPDDSGFSSMQRATGRSTHLMSSLYQNTEEPDYESSSTQVAKLLCAKEEAQEQALRIILNRKKSRILGQQTKTYEHIEQGDEVLYWRAKEKKAEPGWRGPAVAVCVTPHKIWVEHNGTLITVHPCAIRKWRRDPGMPIKETSDKHDDDIEEVKDDPIEVLSTPPPPVHDVPEESSGDEDMSGPGSRMAPGSGAGSRMAPQPSTPGSGAGIRMVPPPDPQSPQREPGPSGPVQFDISSPLPATPATSSGNANASADCAACRGRHRKHTCGKGRASERSNIEMFADIPPEVEPPGAARSSEELVDAEQPLVKQEESEKEESEAEVEKDIDIQQILWAVNQASGAVDRFVGATTAAHGNTYELTWEGLSDGVKWNAYKREYDIWRKYQTMGEVMTKDKIPKLRDDEQLFNARWVEKAKLTLEGPDGRARWTPKGFQDSARGYLPTESPTASAYVQSVIEALGQSRGWETSILDVSGAFFQSAESDRENMWVKLPVEWYEHMIADGTIDKRPTKGVPLYANLLKNVPGLDQAPLAFYQKVEAVMNDMGKDKPKGDTSYAKSGENVNYISRKSHLDPCLFWICRDGDKRPEAAVIVHVDDLKIRGTAESITAVSDHLRAQFDIGSEERQTKKAADYGTDEVLFEYTYTGVRFRQFKDRTEADQEAYIRSAIMPYPLGAGTKEYQSALGSMQWLAGRTRLEQRGRMSRAASSMLDPTPDAHKMLRSAMRHVKKTAHYRRVYPAVAEPFVIETHADASFDNDPGSKSRGGYVVMLRSANDEDGRKVVVDVSARALKRVTQSTYDAECLSVCAAADASEWTAELLAESKTGPVNVRAYLKKFDDPTYEEEPPSDRPVIDLLNDGQGVIKSVNGTKMPNNRRRCIDIIALREFVSRGNTLSHCLTNENMADPVTKEGSPESETSLRLRKALYGDTPERGPSIEALVSLLSVAAWRSKGNNTDTSDDLDDIDPVD